MKRDDGGIGLLLAGVVALWLLCSYLYFHAVERGEWWAFIALMSVPAILSGAFKALEEGNAWMAEREDRRLRKEAARRR